MMFSGRPSGKRMYRIYQVDAFTRERFRGNPAGVVPDARDLTELQMQNIAREMNNSETAFVFPADSDDHDVQVRFFTPKMEVPSCGHATIAAHYVRAVEDQLPTSTVLQKIGIGILPVEVVKEQDDYRVIMTQGKVEFLDVINGRERDVLLSAFQLRIADLEDRCPIQIVSTGHSKVLIGIKSREKLNNIVPDLISLVDLSTVIGCNGYFLFTFDTEPSDILTYGRMFAPAIGIDEDPVTGNANGPLGAYLVHHNLAQHDGKEFRFKSQQGEAVKRTGTADVFVDIENGVPARVRVGGQAVITFRGELEI